MNYLLRNCIHKNNIFILKKNINNNISMIKSSSSLDGIRSLERETIGLNWYFKNSKNQFKLNHTYYENSYYRIEIDYIDGFKPYYTNGIIKNYNYISLAIEHYIEVWNNINNTNETGPIHGDFSIDNLIFKKNNVIIIDWEHFNDGDFPIGFDALNLIFEQLWYAGSLFNSMKAINNLNKLLQSLKAKNFMNKIFYKSTLKNTIDFILANQLIWSEKGLKLPILNFSKEQIYEIDKKINYS